MNPFPGGYLRPLALREEHSLMGINRSFPDSDQVKEDSFALYPFYNKQLRHYSYQTLLFVV